MFSSKLRLSPNVSHRSFVISRFLLHFIMHQTICCQFFQKIPCLLDPFRGPSVGMMSFQLAQVLVEKPKGFSSENAPTKNP